MSQAAPGASRRRLLIAGWHRPGTGFTRVLDALVQRFVTQVDITWVAIGDIGPERRLQPGVQLIPVPMGVGDSVGAYLIRDRLDALAPDAIFALNDLWYLEHYARVLGPVLGSIPLIGYLPLDGDIPVDLVLPDLSAYRTLCTYTRYAADNLRSSIQRAGMAINVAIAGHGIARVQFQPAETVRRVDFAISERLSLAQSLFALNEPTCVALNASRPDPRKRIDLSLLGLAAYRAQGGRDVRLCLHQAIAHDAMAEALRAEIRELNLESAIIWWPKEPGPISDQALTELYNACALGLNTSAGEGFGLVSFEHAACGVPQLLPDLPPLRELWQDAAILLGPPARVRTRWSPLLMSELQPDHVAQGFKKALSDPKQYQTLSHSALARANATEFEWDRVAADIAGLMPEAFGNTGA